MSSHRRHSMRYKYLCAPKLCLLYLARWRCKHLLQISDSYEIVYTHTLILTLQVTILQITFYSISAFIRVTDRRFVAYLHGLSSSGPLTPPVDNLCKIYQAPITKSDQHLGGGTQTNFLDYILLILTE